MTLTTEEVDLLRTTFRQLSQAPGTAAALFYDRLFQIAPEALAKRHVGYGVTPDHYALLAEPLDFMLRQSLGDRCTPELAAAWQKAFAALAAAMIAAAYPAGDRPVTA